MPVCFVCYECADSAYWCSGNEESVRASDQVHYVLLAYMRRSPNNATIEALLLEMICTPRIV